MRGTSRRRLLATTIAATLLAGASTAIAHPFHHRFPHPFPPTPPAAASFTDQVFFNGATLTHTTSGGSEALTQPDDITFGDGHVFVAFQNGVGPQGQPSSSGNTASTIVELDGSGDAIRQWDVVGKCDGLTADPYTGQVVATVNEDANSSLYTIDPDSGTVQHYAYSEALPHGGGTDAISFYRGLMLISASAPGTAGASAPQATYPAVYDVTLDPSSHIATVQPLFDDEASATIVNLGMWGATTLALTDPDSNEDVPWYAPRFAGEFMLTSQGDQQQIYVAGAGTPWQSLSVLNLSSSVDDTAWPSVPWGALLVTDNSGDTIDKITGPFEPGSVLVADTPCDENSAPATCPGPGYPANYLGELDPWTGQITAVNLSGPAVEPQGMLFLP
ncbi:MAG: hypothetical protein ABR946_10965 [Solirubrobacteraceae bacterium]